MVIISVHSYANQLTIHILVKDDKNQPIEKAYVYLFAWNPHEKSTLIATKKTGKNGKILVKIAWRKIMEKWLEKKRQNPSIKRIGLVIHAYDPATNASTTDIIGLPVRSTSIGIVSKELKLKCRRTPSKARGDVYYGKYYPGLPIAPKLEEYWEHTGRFNLLYVKTDSRTTVIYTYQLIQGETTNIRLIFGYGDGVNLYIGDTIYSFSHTNDYKKWSNIGKSNEGYTSVEATFRCEIWGYYYYDPSLNMYIPPALYYEYRYWLEDIKPYTLQMTKGEDPYWGVYSLDFCGRGEGDGHTTTSNPAIIIEHYNLYIQDKKTLAIPITMPIYNYIFSNLPDWVKSFLPTMKLVIEHSEWVSSHFSVLVYCDTDYGVEADVGYLSNFDIHMVRIELSSYELGPGPPP